MQKVRIKKDSIQQQNKKIKQYNKTQVMRKKNRKKKNKKNLISNYDELELELEDHNGYIYGEPR